MPIRAESAAAPARVAVFARAPVAGAVKTRLIPALGATGAAALHRALVLRSLEAAVEAGVGPVELWCAPDASDAFFRDCAARFGIALMPQGGGDLGERMRRAFDALLAASARAVLIGSDIPAMTADYLRAADAALAEGGDAVIGPAEDGGYVLIGLSRPAPELFRDIEWGAPGVAEATRARIARLGLRHVELPVLWDLDRPEDLSRPGVPSLRNMR